MSSAAVTVHCAACTDRHPVVELVKCVPVSLPSGVPEEAQSPELFSSDRLDTTHRKIPGLHNVTHRGYIIVIH